MNDWPSPPCDIWVFAFGHVVFAGNINQTYLLLRQLPLAFGSKCCISDDLYEDSSILQVLAIFRTEFHLFELIFTLLNWLNYRNWFVYVIYTFYACESDSCSDGDGSMCTRIFCGEQG